MEKETALPKNVRQIGDILGNKRIYMEDYVVTYIHKKEKQEETEGFLGVFLGEMQQAEGETRLFIRGLMNIPLDRWEEKTENESGGPESGTKEAEQNRKKKTEKREFSNGKKIEKGTEEEWDTEKWETAASWEEIKQTGEENIAETAEPAEPDSAAGRQERRRKRTVQEECRDYFGDLEILGCCVIGRYQVEPMKRLIEEVPQSRRVLYHLQEQEEHLYWTETGKYEEISGYFVFYEQNRKMQEYMSELCGEKEEEKEKITDQAIKVFREKIKKKDQMQAAGLMKLASSFFVVTVLIVGAVVVTRVGSIRDSSGSDNTLVKTAVQDGGAAGEDNGNFAQSTPNPAAGSSIADTSISDASGAAVNGNSVVSEAVSGPLLSTETASSGNGVTDSAAASGGGIAGDGTAAAGSGAAGDGTAVAGSGAVEDAAAVAGNETADDSTTVAGYGAAGDSTAAAGSGVAGDSTAATGSGVAVDSTAAAGSGAAGGSTAAAGTGVAGDIAAVDGSANGSSAASGDLAVQEDVEASAPVRQIKASYVIREGDTLADICQKYYGSLNRLEELCQENGIQNADMIMPGQKIVLP